MTGKAIRMDRLFSAGKNAVIIAADHGEFDGPIPGMIDLPAVIHSSINHDVDAVLLSPGMLRHCKDVFSSKGAPMAIVRTNWSTTYCFHWQYSQAQTVEAFDVEDAIALGADIVLISLTLNAHDEATDARNVAIFAKMANRARRLGIPVLGEAFPVGHLTMSPDELHDKVKVTTRIITELGADMVKTFYTCRFQEVTGSCPVPILGLGAEKTPTQLEALQLAQREIADGARGVVFGRNALQVPDPIAFQAALCEVVKEGAEPGAMVAKYSLR